MTADPVDGLIDHHARFGVSVGLILVQKSRHGSKLSGRNRRDDRHDGLAGRTVTLLSVKTVVNLYETHALGFG